MTPRGVLAFCREKEVRAVELRYADLRGRWRSLTVPVSRLAESSFEQGFLVNADRWGPGTACERLAIPHAATSFLDPFAAIPTLHLICNLQDPITRDDDAMDGRNVAQRAVQYLESTGIANQARIGSCCQFYIFDPVEFDQEMESTSRESHFDLRNAIMESLIDANVPITRHWSVDERSGQSALAIDASPLVSAADAIMTAKYVVHRTAERQQRVATFMPKPCEGNPGSGMSVQLSLWNDDEPLFGGQGFGGLSEMATYAIGGILKHLPSLTALCNPLTNSYRRLHFTEDSPFTIGYSQHAKQVACNVPSVVGDPRGKYVEIGSPDAAANPYLVSAGLLMAAIDGIQNKIDPGGPIETESQLENSRVERLPRSLWDAIDALQADNDYLQRGDVFSRELIDCWIDYQSRVERPEVESAPTPAELDRYLDC